MLFLNIYCRIKELSILKIFVISHFEVCLLFLCDIICKSNVKSTLFVKFRILLKLWTKYISWIHILIWKTKWSCTQKIVYQIHKNSFESVLYLYISNSFLQQMEGIPHEIVFRIWNEQDFLCYIYFGCYYYCS